MTDKPRAGRVSPRQATFECKCLTILFINFAKYAHTSCCQTFRVISSNLRIHLTRCSRASGARARIWPISRILVFPFYIGCISRISGYISHIAYIAYIGLYIAYIERISHISRVYRIYRVHIGDIAVISRISHVYRVYRVYIAAHFREFTLLTFAFDGQFVEKNLLFQNYFKVTPICNS